MDAFLGLEAADDGPAVESLLDRVFGPERYLKTCQRLRDGRRPAEGLALVERQNGWLTATLRFWEVGIGAGRQGLLLGPLAVDPSCQGTGVGSRLVRYGLNQAAVLGHRAVILVGDEPYYRRFGFTPGLTQRMILPGPVDRTRFLGLELFAGALEGAGGLIRPAARPAEIRPCDTGAREPAPLTTAMAG